jgi:hypothetical protein
MKTIIAILLTAGVTFAAAQWYNHNRQSAHAAAQLAAQTRWETEKAALESALAAAQSHPAAAPAFAATASPGVKSARLSPKEILDKLLALKLGAGVERNRNIRLVVFHLESLRECGLAALPVIRDFFAQNQDIDYTTEENADPNAPSDQNPGGGRGRGRGSNNSLWSFRRGGELRTDFVLPPSLRLGLVDVVRGIGGPEAETILAATLETTGRGIEVAYLAKTLEELAPGKYRDIAIASAKDLLAHPPSIDKPNGADNLAEGYLFDVLQMYNDTSFAAAAQTMIIRADGRIDRNALDYLNSMLKEQAIPALYQVYNSTSLTNQFEKARLARDILGYVGQDSTANQLLADIVNNKDIDARMRGFAVMQLAGGFGQNDNLDAKIYAARIPIVNQLLASTTDAQLVETLNRTLINLAIRATNGVPENPFGRGGRGNRGGPGGGGGG